MSSNNIDDYKTLKDAVKHPGVPYGIPWLRILCDKGTVRSRRFGTGQRVLRVVYMPSLLVYVEAMAEKNKQKFNPWGSNEKG